MCRLQVKRADRVRWPPAKADPQLIFARAQSFARNREFRDSLSWACGAPMGMKMFGVGIVIAVGVRPVSSMPFPTATPHPSRSQNEATTALSGSRSSLRLCRSQKTAAKRTSCSRLAQVLRGKLPGPAIHRPRESVRLFVADNLLGSRVEPDRATQPVRWIGQSDR